jgi:SAM-dependent methyltransferase
VTSTEKTFDPRDLPLPAEDIQRATIAMAGEDALREAEAIYQAFRSLYEAHAGPLSNAMVLDFGCGWGRVYRFFLQAVPGTHIWGIDPNWQSIDLAKEAMPENQFAVIEPEPPSHFETKTLDLIYAYSVFSHLPEGLHLDWLKEFKRILKPGGLILLTTRKRGFIEECNHLRDQEPHRKTRFLDTEAWVARYDRGEFCFDTTIEAFGEDVAKQFGDACIPEVYVRDKWSELFEVLEYRDDLLVQSLIVCRA